MNMNEQTNGNGIMKRMQVRTEYQSEYAIHIQILGSINVNRTYGYANELRAPQVVIDWLSQQEPILESGASAGSNYYIQMDAVEFDDNTHALLIHGTPLNHEKGCLLGVNPSPTVTQVFDYAKQGECVVSMNKSDAMTTAQHQETEDNISALDTQEEE
jgi:hypothetical protein